MGMQRAITLSAGKTLTWPMLQQAFALRNLAVSIRMIDGLPAFPDEVPEETWKELRLGFPAGMVTLRRDGPAWTCVIWGNSDAELVKAWDQCCEVIEAHA